MHFGPMRGSQNYQPVEKPKIASVIVWYDRSLRLHTALFVDDEGNQLGVAHYACGQEEKKSMVKTMKGFVGETAPDYQVWW